MPLIGGGFAVLGCASLFFWGEDLLLSRLRAQTTVWLDERITFSANQLEVTVQGHVEGVAISDIASITIEDGVVVIEGAGTLLSVGQDRSPETLAWLVETLKARVQAWLERAGTEDEVPQALAALRQTT